MGIIESVHDDKIFDNEAYHGEIITGKEFQSCIFRNCDFSESRLLNNKFLDCIFEDCNLSMCKLEGSTLNNALFKRCKILGVIFSECQEFLFSVEFAGCILDYASFMGRKMLKTRFSRTSLKDVNFIGANLSGSVFEESDLLHTIFNGTNLTGVNFSSAYHYDIDPELNILHKAIFSSQGLQGLLSRHQLKII
jgi:uncharacterized protein YjbI with pentapeptide repeats